MIIALSGIPGAGKDAIGVALKHHMNSVRTGVIDPSFGNPLKPFSIKKFAGKPNVMYAEITRVNYSGVDRETHEIHRAKFREFAESMKTIFGQDIWAKALLDPHLKHKSNNWIITDLRFTEELAELRKKDDVYLIRIRRMCHECLMVETHTEGCSQDNITDVETRLASYYGWDLIVNNDSTPEEAAEEIADFIIKQHSKQS